MTPNEVKQKRNVSAAAAESAGASWGTVTSRARRERPGSEHGGGLVPLRVDPRPGAADDARHDGDVEEDVRGEDRPDARARSRRAAAARNAVATTTVGSTNGTSTSARTSDRPRNRNRPTAHASGSPAASVSAVDAAACQIVNQSEPRPSRPGATSPPPERRGRARGSPRAETRRRARGTPPGRRSWRRCTRVSAQDGCVHSSIQRSRLRADLRRGQLERLRGRRRRTCGTPRQRRPSRTGSTNMLSGTAAWNRSESMKSISAGRLSRLRAPRGRRRTRPGGSSCRSTTAVGAVGERLLGEDHLGRRARRVGDDDRPLALAAAGAREPRRVRLLPAVHDQHAVRPQPAPVVLPARARRSGRRSRA